MSFRPNNVGLKQLAIRCGRDGFTCLYSSCTSQAECVHHVWPLSLGGDNEWTNLMALCTCHHKWFHAGCNHADCNQWTLGHERMWRFLEYLIRAEPPHAFRYLHATQQFRKLRRVSYEKDFVLTGGVYHKPVGVITEIDIFYGA